MARVVAEQIKSQHTATFGNDLKIHELDLTSHLGSSAATSSYITAELRKNKALDLKSTVLLARIGGGAASLRALDVLLK